MSTQVDRGLVQSLIQVIHLVLLIHHALILDTIVTIIVITLTHPPLGELRDGPTHLSLILPED